MLTKPIKLILAEQLEFVPASSRVIRHVRPKLAWSSCDVIVQAPALAKFADRPPLCRQAVNNAWEGIDLDRALPARGGGAASALLRPLVAATCWRH